MAELTPDGTTVQLLFRGVDRLPSMVAYWDAALICRYANRAYERWFGVDPNALIGTSVRDLLGPELFALNEPYIRGALIGQEQTFERLVPGPNGVSRPSLAHYVPDVVDGVVRGFFVQVTEVSQLKAVELALRAEIARREQTGHELAASETALHCAQALGQVGSWQWDIATDTTRWSPELYRIFGRDSAQPAPSYAEHAQLWTARSWAQMQQAFATARDFGTSYCLELQYHRPDGSLGWLEARGECVEDADGRITGLRGTAQVVTERKAGEAAQRALVYARQARSDRALLLRYISERIRTALNSVSGYAYLLGGDQVPQADRQHWADLIAQGVAQVIELISAVESPTFSLVEDAMPPGGPTPSSAPAPGGIAADITERKRLEEQVRSSEERLAALMDVIPCPALVYDDAGTILHVSKALTQITGYGPDEMPTRAAWARLAYQEEDARDIAARLETVARTARAGDGGERTVRTKSGETRTWHLFATPAGFSLDGRQIIVAIGNDITERKRDEAALSQMKARSESFMAMIADELRPPLIALEDAASLVRQRSTAAPDLQQAADTVARQTRHMARLIDDLLEGRSNPPLPDSHRAVGD